MNCKRNAPRLIFSVDIVGLNEWNWNKEGLFLSIYICHSHSINSQVLAWENVLSTYKKKMEWRCRNRSDSNLRIEVLQTSALATWLRFPINSMSFPLVRLFWRGLYQYVYQKECLGSDPEKDSSSGQSGKKLISYNSDKQVLLPSNEKEDSLLFFSFFLHSLLVA